MENATEYHYSTLTGTNPDYDKLKEQIVFRVISARSRYGHWFYLYDDPMVQSALKDYLFEVIARGAERITIHRLGAFKDVLGSKAPRSKVHSIAHERLNHKLDEYIPSDISEIIGLVKTGEPSDSSNPDFTAYLGMLCGCGHPYHDEGRCTYCSCYPKSVSFQ